MELVPDLAPVPQMRTRDEVLDQLRAVRLQYRKGYGPQRLRLQVQNQLLCWILGAERGAEQELFGGILNVDF